jgi:arginase family enzyme
MYIVPMATVHFFKAKSRLGLPNLPAGQSEKNIGVEEAPDAILTPAFLAKFPDSRVNDYNFPKPEQVKDNYTQVLVETLNDFREFINDNLEMGETQVVVGGENSVTFSSLLADQDRFGRRFGYIQFDSHGESNLYSTSPTKNFHGMYLRPFLDNFDVPEIDRLVSREKLTKENTLFIGNLNLDGDEPSLFKRLGLVNINKEDITKNKAQVLKQVREFIKKFDHIHINFDVDVFDKSIVIATGIPAEKGLFMADIVPILLILSTKPFSLDLSEVNPRKKGARETIDIAQKVVYILTHGSLP